MTLTMEQMKSFEDAAKPMIKWLNDNCHPHVEVVVTTNSAELFEGVFLIKNDEFIKD